jgi:molecular chaperone DnaK
MKVGLDFGTTNSIISYWDENSQRSELFQYNNKTYTPTAIAYSNSKVADIGENALDIWRNDHEEINLFRFFKTYLSKEDQTLSAFGWNENKLPSELTKDFITEFISRSSNSIVKNKGAIESIVVSVPELWQKNIVNRGASNLENIFRELNLPLKQLISEPLAATAYFIWKHNELVKSKKKVLVCDMGGGTFDVALCDVEGDIIKVLAFDGNEDNKAGVFDLKEILKNIYNRNKITIDEDSFEFKNDLWELDKQIQTDRYNQILEEQYPKYLSDKEETDATIFKVNQKKVFLKDIYEAFPPIGESINSVLNKITKENKQNFQFDYLLFVGGFSRYFLVRKTILDFFGLTEEDEKVKIIPKQDSLFAVSYGASLVAADKIQIKEYYDHTIFYGGHDETNRRIDIPIIQARDIITHGKPFYSQHEVYIKEDNEITLEGYILENGITRKDFAKQIKFSFSVSKEETYCPGIEINRANVAYFVLRDSCNTIHKFEIGELLNSETCLIKN